MQDVSPELLNRIRSDFRKSCRKDKQLGTVIDRIDSGKGTYREAQELAGSLGDKLGEAYKGNLTAETLPDGRLYRNIAEKVIRPTLHDNYELVSEASQKVQKALNDEAGIGLKVQIPEEDTDRVDGIIDRVSDHVDEFTSETADDLASMTENFTHHVVDAFIEKNADFQYSAGLKPKIERDAMAECCEWCLDLAGTYEYPLKDRSVFQRHKDCRCVVDYHPGNGKVQNAHTKQWRDEADSDILEARKTANLEPLVDPAKVDQRKQSSGSLLQLNLQFFSTGKERAEELGSNWEVASLREAIEKYANGAEGELNKTGSKLIYHTPGSSRQIVYDILGDYFRIENLNRTGRRRYDDLEGNDVSNITENGRTRGRTKVEYESVTHFMNGDSNG